MHPSKAQQSTTKAPDSGLRLGFSDIKNKSKLSALESTPSKSAIMSDGFEFKFAHSESELSNEAKRIMESVREEAARIKETLRVERDEQNRKDEETEQIIRNGRRIAMPKKKAGRFSDVHKEQFRNMDSIANHASLWKNKSITSPLKRTLSRTDSDDKDQISSLKRTQSKADLSDDRLENTAPGKRARTSDIKDVSAARPVSRDGSNIPRFAFPSAISTPTKASLARTTSVKTPSSTKIPTLGHSKSTKELSTLAKLSTPNKLEDSKPLFGLKKSISMKSILSKPQPKFSNDPLKIAAGTHIPTPDTAGTPVRSIKRVGFADNLTSPLPSKIPEPKSPSPVKIAPTPMKMPEIKSPSPVKPASEIRLIEATTTITKIPTFNSPEKISYPQLNPLSSNPPRPGDFTFRADRQIQFSPSKTIRRVRPSGVPTMTNPFEGLPSVPHGMPNKKRRRVEDDEDEERENRPPVGEASPSKKLKMKIGEDIKPPVTPHKKLVKSQPGSVHSEKKGISLGRLNFLARPKARR
jgi:hypothetical protein